MIKGILCSTSTTEPWAARVGFELINNTLVTKLKKSHTHYKNLFTNHTAVLVFTNKESEVIIKSVCSLKDINEDYCKAIFEIYWTRIVNSEDTNDYLDSQKAKEVANTFIGDMVI